MAPTNRASSTKKRSPSTLPASTSTSESVSLMSSPPTTPPPASPSERTPLTKPLNGHAHHHDADARRHRVFHRKPRLLTFAESLVQVPWQTDNEFVTRGYRPQLYNVRACLWSAIGYVHNETVNIHSHSLGALFFAILLPLHVLGRAPSLGTFPSADQLPPATFVEKIGMAVYCVSAITCLGLSSWFHTVQCCNRGVCEIAHCGDYVGIVVLIVGSMLPCMHYGFHDNPFLRAFYMIGIATAGLTAGYFVLSPHHRNHRWDRTLVFIALGLSGVFPVGHIVLSKGLTFARTMMGFDYILACGASYIFGALLYAARIPESIWPGKFDFVGSSHQIFHGFVLLGAWFQYSALRWMIVGNSTAA